MKSQKMEFNCRSCGRGAGFSLGAPPCEALQGWITVSRWKGSSSVEHHNFCSFSCLQEWVETQIPRIPEVFLEYLEEDNT